MIDSPIFDCSEKKLSLLTDRGRSFLGLGYSSSHELNERVRGLFEYLDGRIGFSPGPQGEELRECFNSLIRYTYPEIMIDLADLIYVQHERPMVYLSFDHIQGALRNDKESLPLTESLTALFEKMEFLFRQLAEFIKSDRSFFEDSEIVRFLAESYSYYLYETQNFPWEEPIQDSKTIKDKPILDVATGLVGFSLIHEWPESFPNLYLTDRIPFILEGLSHFMGLTGKKNIKILEIDFPNEVVLDEPLGAIWVNKFLHHLSRNDRQKLLSWAFKVLAPMGILSVIDTDLERQILKESKNPEFIGKLIPGYLETLVEIEDEFTDNLHDDVKNANFEIKNFDSHEYLDETDAYSLEPQEQIKLKFVGFEIEGCKGK
jgi:hypothetical protein